MNALVLKLTVDGMRPAEIADALRKLADSMNAGCGAEEGFAGLAGELSGTLRLPDCKPAMRALDYPSRLKAAEGPRTSFLETSWRLENGLNRVCSQGVAQTAPSKNTLSA